MNPSASWSSFDNAGEQSEFGIIPAGSLVKVGLRILPGGCDDAALGLSCGWATQAKSGAVYLDIECVVLEGAYARRRLWIKIGLHSPNGPAWAQMGRATLRAILNSAKGFHPKDNSPPAVKARCIQSFGDLNGMTCVIRVGTKKDLQGNDRNTLGLVIEPNHGDYARIMGIIATPMNSAASPTPASQFASSIPVGGLPDSDIPF
ncbi:DUF669 domain-containing protein [Gammaproteobacteria bacterium]